MSKEHADRARVTVHVTVTIDLNADYTATIRPVTHVQPVTLSRSTTKAERLEDPDFDGDIAILDAKHARNGQSLEAAATLLGHQMARALVEETRRLEAS